MPITFRWSIILYSNNYMPYSGKLSREKTFAVSMSFVKNFSAKVCGYTYIIIGRTRAIRKSFLREILVLYRYAVYYAQKFSIYRSTCNHCYKKNPCYSGTPLNDHP